MITEMFKQRTCVRGLALLAIFATASGPVRVSAQAFTVVGPPSYQSVSSVLEDRGSGLPGGAIILTRAGWNGNGSSGLAAHTVTVPGGHQLTAADGIAMRSRLGSLSRATGLLASNNPNNPAHVHATNRADYTLFGAYVSNTLAQTTPEFFAFFDGSLTTTAAFELLDAAATEASVRFGLNILDEHGALLDSVFEVTATSSLNLNAPSLWTLATGATGLATPATWNASITDITPRTFFNGNKYDVNYFEVLPRTYAVPTNIVYGFNWYIETTAHMEGLFATSALIEADFLNTAMFGMSIDPAHADQVMFVEALAYPAPVPVPPAGLLLGAVLTGAAALRRRHHVIRDRAGANKENLRPGIAVYARG